MLVHKIFTVGKELGLSMIINKIIYMIIKTIQNNCMVKRQLIETVENYLYLGKSVRCYVLYILNYGGGSLNTKRNWT